MTNTANHSDSYSQGLIIGFRMVQVAIGITVSRSSVPREKGCRLIDRSDCSDRVC